jgi:hypothetical protein
MSKTYTMIMDNIHDTMAELNGEEVANIHNQICSNKVKYNSLRDMFDDIETNDDEKCKYCGEECWNGDMCDEQRAGGFNE